MCLFLAGYVVAEVLVVYDFTAGCKLKVVVHRKHIFKHQAHHLMKLHFSGMQCVFYCWQ